MMCSPPMAQTCQFPAITWFFCYSIRVVSSNAVCDVTKCNRRMIQTLCSFAVAELLGCIICMRCISLSCGSSRLHCAGSFIAAFAKSLCLTGNVFFLKHHDFDRWVADVLICIIVSYKTRCTVHSNSCYRLTWACCLRPYVHMLRAIIVFGGIYLCVSAQNLENYSSEIDVTW